MQWENIAEDEENISSVLSDPEVTKLKYSPLLESKLTIQQNICSLQEALPINTTLVTFELFTIKFDQKMTNCLFEGLSGNSTLRTLRITNCVFKCSK